MLGSNNGIDNGGEVIDIGKRFYTKNDIVESALSTSGSIFWCSDNYNMSLISMTCNGSHGRGTGEERIPWRGLKRSLPKTGDL